MTIGQKRILFENVNKMSRKFETCGAKTVFSKNKMTKRYQISFRSAKKT